MKKRIVSLLLAVVMTVSMIPFSAIPAFADEPSGTEPAGGSVSYIGQDGDTDSVDDYVLIDEDTCLWESGTYVAAGDVTLSGFVTVSGTVDLILSDGARLTASGDEGEAAVFVPEESTLNIYGQSGSSGKLTAIGGGYAAGIGGCDLETFPELTNGCGTVNVYGGRVTAVGCSGGAGIGGGWGGDAESISIFGGIVNAECDGYFGSAIGAGEEGTHGAEVLLAGGYTYAVGKIAVTGDVTIADVLCAYDFDTPQQQYSADGWRVGYEGNPSKNVLIGPCTYFENGTEHYFPTYINIYRGQSDLGGFYFAADDFVLSKKLTAASESQLVLADGVAFDVTGYGREVGNDLHVYTASSGNAHGRMPGGLVYDKQGKPVDVSLADYPVYEGETELTAGTYYVTEDHVLDETLTSDGRITFVLEDGVTLDLRNGGVQTGGNGIRVLTTSFDETKGRTLPSLLVYNEQGETVTFSDFSPYEGQTTLTAGAYYVGEDHTIEGPLAAEGAVTFLLADGVTLKAELFEVVAGGSFRFYTESSGSEKGTFSGSRMKVNTYIDASGTACELPESIVRYNGESTLQSGWYLFWGKGLSDRLTIDGDVKIVLVDGSVTSFESGITLLSGKKLTVFAQSDGSGMGTLNANKELKGNTGIGSYSQYFGGSNCGTLVINGGFVNAYGNSESAGIGGGFCGNGGAVTINGGVVTAVSGGKGAGIGGGSGVYSPIGFVEAGDSDYYTSGGTVTVNGGVVNAVGSSTAAAIGGGYNGAGADITINGGTVNATAAGGAAIGGGDRMRGTSSRTTLSSDMIGYTTGSKNTWFDSQSVGSVLSDQPSGFCVTSKDYYLPDGTHAGMVSPKLYKSQTALTGGEWYVRDNVTLTKPLFIEGDVTLILEDGVTFDASADVFFTAKGSFTVGTKSTGAKKGVFSGTVYGTGSEEGGGEIVPRDMLFFNGETLLTGAYLVSQSFSAEEPLVIDGSVSLYLCDGVVFSAPKGFVVTEGSTFAVRSLSDGDDCGVFVGEKLTGACGKTFGEYVKLYSGEMNMLGDGWYYVRRDVTSQTGILIAGTAHIIIPDGVTLDVPDGIYLTETAVCDVCPLSAGEDAGRMTGEKITGYIDGSVRHIIPDRTEVFDPESPVLGSGPYLVLSDDTVTVVFLENENTSLLIADGVTLTASDGYFGYAPVIRTFSEGSTAGRFVGKELTYLDGTGVSRILPADTSFYNGETELRDGVWFVNRSREVSERIVVSGDVMLVLGDGVKLEADKGIKVPAGSSLTITSQSDGEKAGQLFAFSLRYGRHPDSEHYYTPGVDYDVDYDSAIGGGSDGDNGSDDSFGEVTIRNGIVEAHAFDGAAAIGSAYNGGGGSVTIRGGTVRAYGYSSEYGIGGSDSSVAIYGGSVTVGCDDSDAPCDHGIGGAKAEISGGDVRTEDNALSAVFADEVIIEDPMRVFDLENKLIYSDECLTGVILEEIRSVRIADASYTDEEGNKVPFSEEVGRILTADDTLEEDVWYYAMDDVSFDGRLTVGDRSHLVIEDGVTVSAGMGVLLPASGVMNVHTTSLGDNKGVFSGKAYRPYLDGEGTAHVLPASVETYTGCTELPCGQPSSSADPAWYYVDSDCALTEVLVIRGEVSLVLTDGVTLDLSKGIVVEEGGRLNVYYTSDSEDKGVFIGEEKGYFDENAAEKRLPDGFMIYGGETALADGWYLVRNDYAPEDVLTVSGDVTLVLADGVTLTAGQGILLTSGNSLTVCSLSLGEEMGGITAIGGDLGVAGIGGNYANRAAGDLCVNGGKIKAYGAADAAGIGGGVYGQSGTIVFNGGMIEAEGGIGTDSAAKAAGIGGGMSGGSDGIVINNVISLRAKGGRALGAGIGAVADPDRIVIADGLLVLSGGVPIETIGSETEITVTKTGVSFSGASLTLGSEISINFYMDLTDEARRNGTMTFDIGGRTVTLKGADAGYNTEKMEYCFSIPLTVLEMAETVTAVFEYSGVEYVKEYSVKEYIEAILGGSYSGETKLLVRKIANYGYYAQIYLESLHSSVIIVDPDVDPDGGYDRMIHFGNTAEGDFDVNVAAAKEALADHKVTVSGESENFSLYGSTVYFDSATALNYYVRSLNGEKPDAACNGKTVTVTGYKGYQSAADEKVYIVSVKDIFATELADDICVSVNGEITLTGSVFAYCNAVMTRDGQTDAAKNAMAAFCEYYLAAQEYADSTAFPHHDTLDEYSWEELKTVSEAISDGTIPAKEMSRFEGFAEEAETKKVRMNSEKEDYLYVRIIGFNHDRLASGEGYAGITFMAVNSINQAYYSGNKGDENSTYAAGWAAIQGSSPLRDKMQPDGEIYNLFPEELLGQLERVTKLSRTGWTSDSDYSSVLMFSNDYLFLLSGTELGSDLYGNDEGTEYEYIDCVPGFYPQSWVEYSGVLFSGVNSEGYEFITENAAGCHWIDELLTALSEAGGGVNCDNPYCVFTRSAGERYDVYCGIDYSGQVYATPVWTSACVAPCFCIG